MSVSTREEPKVRYRPYQSNNIVTEYFNLISEFNVIIMYSSRTNEHDGSPLHLRARMLSELQSSAEEATFDALDRGVRGG